MDDLRFVISVDDRDLIKSQKEQKKFERNILTIEQAFRKNQITSSRYTSELNKQAKQLSKLGGSYHKALSEVKSYSSSVRNLTDDQLRMAQATNMAGKSTNRFGMYAQQVGYQVGDFFVQVQSGTSALVAFGQQGTQLAGLLPGVTGAVVGISLAVGTMLARSFMEASGEAATLEEAIENASDALSDYNDALDNILDSSVNSTLSDTAKHFDSIAKSASALAKMEMFKGLGEAIDKMAIAPTRLETMFDDLKNLFDLSTLLMSSEERKLSSVERSKAINLSDLGLSKDLTTETYESLTKGIKEAYSSQDARQAVKLLDELYTTAFDGSKPTKAGLEFLDAIKKQADMLRQTIAEMNLGASVAGGRGQDPSKFTDRYSASFKLEAELSKERIKAQKASDAAFEKSLKKFKATEKKQNAIVEKVKLQYTETYNLFGLEGKQLLLAKQRMEVTALENKLIESGIEKGSRRYEVTMLALSLDQALKVKTYEQIEADKKLNEKLKERAELQDQINKAVAKSSAEIEKEQKKFADGIANSFGSAFTSMIEGTKSVKDAFRDMARDIISQLYKVLVVEQMVQSISGVIQGAMIPSGLGNVSGAPQLRPPSLDGGGYTGSGSRSGGLDGKGGFMAMLHPQETVIDHTKHNSSKGSSDSGSVVINQNFSFSANGDDSVKKIIAQAAPKIAQMTKSEILNDRRRGGTMKATFG